MCLDCSPQPATLHDLTPRQIAVASLVAHGYRVKQIAARLDITERRVLCHISSIAHRCHLDMEKDDKVQVAVWYLAHVEIQEGPIPIRTDAPARAVA